MSYQKIIFLFVFLALSNPVYARIKLVALPDRENIRVSLDNPQATLVEEQRTLTLHKGINKVDFSWKGVLIKPDSIRLAILENADSSNLLNVSYPPNSQSLVWEIYSPEAGQETIKISYLLENIDRIITYEALTNSKETRLDLSTFLVLRNFSGESFELAGFQLSNAQTLNKSIKDGETKRILFQTDHTLPLNKIFTFDAGKQPWEPDKLDNNTGIPVYYELVNNESGNLGKYALWEGKFRIFQDDGNNNSIFLGEDQAGFTPVDQTMELYIGDSRDLVITQKKIKYEKINMRRNNKDRIVLYDDRETMKIEIENFRDAPAFLRILEPMQGEWEINESSHKYHRKDSRQLEYELTIPANRTVTVQFTYTVKNRRG